MTIRQAINAFLDMPVALVMWAVVAWFAGCAALAIALLAIERFGRKRAFGRFRERYTDHRPR